MTRFILVGDDGEEFELYTEDTEEETDDSSDESDPFADVDEDALQELQDWLESGCPFDE